MVIVGAGHAGARAALALRERGWTGPVTLIGGEPHLPYERPPLSKAMLAAGSSPHATPILEDRLLHEHDIDLRCGSAAVAIDRDVHEVACDDGRCVVYERLLIATGSRARRLQIQAGSDILYLRTLLDAQILHERLQPGMRVAIIGGGYIGLEIAACAVARGCAVTVIELAPRLLTRGVPEAIAEAIKGIHLAAGVTLRVGATIKAIEQTHTSHAVMLSTNERIACDVIVAGVGAVPETSLAERASIAVDNGIRVDEHLRTSDPNIFAAGDCCSFPHRLYDGRRIRLEAWRNAQDQGAVAAANMMGAGEIYSAVPSFWSDQYDQTVQIVGLPDAGTVTLHRRLGEAGDLYFHLAADGQLVAASGLGPTGKIARDIRLAEMLIARRARPDPSALEAPHIALKSLLAA